jgi:hypothetical protein
LLRKSALYCLTQPALKQNPYGRVTIVPEDRPKRDLPAGKFDRGLI